MKLICLKKLLFSTGLIVFLSNSYSQAIERRFYKTNFTEKAPQIDGLLNDDFWDQVDWSGGFVQSDSVKEA